MDNTSETELAWAAGLYDGEGCTFYTKKKSMRLHVSQSVSNHEDFPEVLTRFRNAVGGVGQFYLHHIQNPKKPCYIWTSNKKSDVWQVINLLWPYLSTVKKQQILKAFRSIKDHQRPDTKREFCKNGHLMEETRKYYPSGTSYCGVCASARNDRRRDERRNNGINIAKTQTV